MIFSVWRPDGGYDYYESSRRHGIGDDLPDADLPPALNEIGIPSQDAGRLVPSGSRHVGRGEAPKGVMAPMDRTAKLSLRGLSGIAVSGGFWVNCLIAGGLVWVGYELGRKK